MLNQADPFVYDAGVTRTFCASPAQLLVSSEYNQRQVIVIQIPMSIYSGIQMSLFLCFLLTDIFKSHSRSHRKPP